MGGRGTLGTPGDTAGGLSPQVALRSLPEEAVKETLEYKVLQSQFSLLYHESLQVKTQLDEARALLLATKNSHLRHIEHMEVRGRVPEVASAVPKAPGGSVLVLGVMGRHGVQLLAIQDGRLRPIENMEVALGVPKAPGGSLGCPIGPGGHGTSRRPTVGHPRWPPPSY